MTETAATPPPPRRPRIDRSQHNAGANAGQGPDSAREALKHEVARELGLEDDLADPDRLSVREAGKIGGQMVRRLIRAGKRRLAEKQDPGSSR